MNDFQFAVAHAALKQLEQYLADDNLPPGSSFDVSNQSITITLPPNMIVSRAAGINGDGIRPTNPTTNFYGWGPLVLMVIIAIKFKQYNAVFRRNIIECVTEALKCGTTTEEKLLERNPHLKKDIETMKTEILRQLPERQEPTRKTIKNGSKLSAVFSFFSKKVA